MAKVSKAVWKSSNGLSTTFGQVGGMIVKTINDELENMALEVQKKAREYVPVDLGYAESAIKVDKSSQRRKWAVYLDMSVMATHDGRTYPVGEYLMWLHENQSYKLGEKSEQKAALLHVDVGPKFLERAFRDVITDKRLGEVETDLNEVIKSRQDAQVRKRLAQDSARQAAVSKSLENGNEG